MAPTFPPEFTWDQLAPFMKAPEVMHKVFDDIPQIRVHRELIPVTIPRKQTEKKQWNLTVVTHRGIIQVPHVMDMDAPLPKTLSVHIPRPEKESDPRKHWDDHLEGDVRLEVVTVHHLGGTVYTRI